MGVAAEANVARFESTGRVDVACLGSLSADAIPALVTLPRPQRCEALQIMAGRTGVGSAEVSVGVLVPVDPWFAGNASRAAALQELAADAC